MRARLYAGSGVMIRRTSIEADIYIQLLDKLLGQAVLGDQVECQTEAEPVLVAVGDEISDSDATSDSADPVGVEVTESPRRHAATAIVGSRGPGPWRSSG